MLNRLGALQNLDVTLWPHIETPVCIILHEGILSLRREQDVLQGDIELERAYRVMRAQRFCADDPSPEDSRELEAYIHLAAERERYLS